MDGSVSRQPWYRARSARSLGQAIRSVRRDHQTTQIELSDAARISRATVQRMEGGSDVGLSAALAAIAELGYEVVVVPRGASIEVHE